MRRSARLAEPRLFEQYPKTRPPLPDRIATIYAEQYRANREGETRASSAAQRMEAWMHRQVARDVLARPDEPRSTLEIGAGTLNQLPYEPEVGPYDIVEPFVDLYSGSRSLPRIRDAWSDVAQVPERAIYDRITSVAALEHICNLPEVVARCGLLLSPGGVFRAAIPSEGTFLWALGWRLTTGLEFRLKHGLDYGSLMRHEHVNGAGEIRDVLGFFFERVDCRVFGLARAVSLYQFYACRNPATDRCSDYLRQPRPPGGS
ncbi:MAG: class I SAM-dependent methyltransferase [Gaiellaceae bacterium]